MTENNRPLLITSSLSLIDEVIRLASTSALEVHVVGEMASAADRWLTAPLVLVGSDIHIDNPPSRRARVLVVHSEDTGIDGAGTIDTRVQRDMWRFAVELGAEHVVELPDGEQWLIDAFRECADGPTRDGLIVPVIGGTGGLGTSTFATNLAVVATREGMRTLLVDADGWGGGLDLLVGAEDTTGTRWPDLRQLAGHVPSGHLAAALPKVGGISLLSCGRESDGEVQAEAMNAVLQAGRRSHDIVLVDCPRDSGALVESIVHSADDAVLLVGDHVRAAAAASRRRSWLQGAVRRLHLVRATTPRGLSEDDIAHALGSHFTACVPFVPSMPLRADEGELPALPRAYVQACQLVLAAVGGAHDRVRAA